MEVKVPFCIPMVRFLTRFRLFIHQYEKGENMNQLANLIKRRIDEDTNSGLSDLPNSECVAFRPINGLLQLSATELKTLIKQKGGPQDWMILPCRKNSKIDVP